MHKLDDKKEIVAIMLKYTKEVGLPYVLSSSSGALAQSIISRAKEIGVPIFESEIATRLSKLREGQCISENFIQAIGEIYAYIYNFEKETLEKR